MNMQAPPLPPLRLGPSSTWSLSPRFIFLRPSSNGWQSNAQQSNAQQCNAQQSESIASLAERGGKTARSQHPLTAPNTPMAPQSPGPTGPPAPPKTRRLPQSAADVALSARNLLNDRSRTAIQKRNRSPPTLSHLFFSLQPLHRETHTLFATVLPDWDQRVDAVPGWMRHNPRISGY